MRETAYQDGTARLKEIALVGKREWELTFDAVPDMVLLLDEQCRILRANRAVAKFANAEFPQLIGRRCYEVLSCAKESPQGCPHERILQTGQEERGEIVDPRSSRVFEATVSPLLERAGIMRGCVCVMRDITERKRVEETLHVSETRYRRLFETAKDGILIVNATTGKIIDVNPFLVDLLGYSREDFLGKSLWEIGPFKDIEACKIAFRELQDKEYIRYEDLPLETSDGVAIDVEFVSNVYQVDGLKVFQCNIRDITERKRGHLALERANRTLRTLSVCNETLVHAESEPAFLDAICRLIVEIGGYCMAWVGFSEWDPAKTVRPVAHFGREEGYLATSKFSWADIELGRDPTGTAIRTGTVQVNRNFLTDPASVPWREVALKLGYLSSIALPLKGPAGILGALTIAASEPRAFDDAEVKLLQELAADLAFGIETLRTRTERDRNANEHLHHAEMLRQSLEDSVKAIANTVEMRDPYTAGHQRRVAELAVAISRELELPEEMIRGIEIGASIHDLGKISVPAEILAKPTKLTDIESMLIQNHVQAGYDILKDIKFPWPIATMVLQHHEILDGSGYPQGLKRDNIILEARILAVADVVEAMSSHRPYRPAKGIDAALEEIFTNRETRYDPAVVDACLKLFREKGFRLSTG